MIIVDLKRHWALGYWGSLDSRYKWWEVRSSMQRPFMPEVVFQCSDEKTATELFNLITDERKVVDIVISGE